MALPVPMAARQESIVRDFEAITLLEERTCQALVAFDHAVLDAIFSDTLVHTHSSGRVDSKSSYLAQLSPDRRYLSMRLEDVQMRGHGDAVFCTGRVVADVEHLGQKSLWTARYSHAWIRAGESWQLALFHATTISHA